MVKDIHKILEELEYKFNNSSEKEQELLEEKLLDIIKNIIKIIDVKNKQGIKNDQKRKNVMDD